MSFLDVLDSIGTGQRLAAPQPQQTVSAPPMQSLSNDATAKPSVTKASAQSNGASVVARGKKWKVDDTSRAGREKPSLAPTKRGAIPVARDADVSPSFSSPMTSKSVPAKVGSSASAITAAKPPKPGSFAALMAEAKATQEQKAKNQVGQIMHQATVKERISKSEKRKREEEEKALKAKIGKQPQHNNKVSKKGAGSQKQRLETTYKGTAKPAPTASSYRGTAGRPSQHRPSSADARNKAGKGPSKYDEYLGTDEEDEEDEVDHADMEDGYDSEVSSDMEAGALDVEEEESKALRQARADDARELALEGKLKREKEERRKRLEALAKKRR